MPSDREEFTLSGLSLSDGTKFDLEGLDFTPAPKRPQFVSNADSDGEMLVRESNYGNATLEFTLRVAHQETADEAREALGELTDALQGCERTEGGATLLWTPHDSETVYTAYAVLAEYTAIPIVVQGDDAGYFLNAPRVRVKLTLRPFLYRPERTAVEAKESAAAPAQELFIKEVKGDVPAEARLIITDKATQNRRFAAWGRDIVDSEEPPAALITAASLVTEGFSGETKGREGAYGFANEVKRATAVSSATTMCSTGSIEHVGSFAVYLRVYAASEDARFRISYRNGDGPLIPLKWVTPPVISNFSEIYMGEVFLDKVELGEQTSEIRVEVKSAGASLELDVNYLLLWPTRAALSARAPANNEPTKLLAYDQFEQTEGALSGKSANLGGTWAGAGDTADFTVIAASDVARRTATSDADIVTGRYAVLGSQEPESTSLSVVVEAASRLGSSAKTDALRMGVLARYENAENWLMAVINGTALGGGGELSDFYLRVYKRDAGTTTQLGSVLLREKTALLGAATVNLSVTTAGAWTAEAEGKQISGQDSALAAGGSLAAGKVGIYDAWVQSASLTRNFSLFTALAAEASRIVCYSGQCAKRPSR